MKRPREETSTRPNKRGRPGKDEAHPPEPKKAKTQEETPKVKREKGREQLPPPPPPLEEASPSPKKAGTPAGEEKDLAKLSRSELESRVKKAEKKSKQLQSKTKVAEIRLAVLENLLRDAKSREHNLEQQKEEVCQDLKLQRQRRKKAETEMGEHIDALEQLDKKAKKQANAASATKNMMFFQEVQYAKALLLAQNCVQKLEKHVLGSEKTRFEAESRNIRERLQNESRFELLLFAKLEENARREQQRGENRDRRKQADRDTRRSRVNGKKGGGITMNIPTTTDYIPHMAGMNGRTKESSPDFSMKGQSTRNPPDVTGLLKNSRTGGKPEHDPTKRKPSQAELTAIHQIAKATSNALQNTSSKDASSLWGGQTGPDGLTEEQRAGIVNRLASALPPWLGV